MDMYVAGMGWNYDALERITRPRIDVARYMALTMPEPTPVERGVLDRYQDRKRRQR